MNTRPSWLHGMVAVALATAFGAGAEETAPLDADSLQTPQQEIGAELSAASTSRCTA